VEELSMQIPNVTSRPRRILGRLSVLAGVLAAAILLFGASPASARVFVHLGIGVPVFAGPPVFYGPPPYYYPPPPPPAYYAPPPPASYYPPPASAEPAGPPESNGAYSTETCREYQTTTRIDGAMHPSYGTACLQPDGTWRIVN
jgi:hypothetical protein